LDRAFGAFESPNAGIGVDGHDQSVPQSAGLLEASNVASVEKVEATVCENDLFISLSGRYYDID
jgi:hypothetical protein